MPIDYSDSAQPKGTPRVVTQRARTRAREHQERAVRQHVQQRDDHRCRACGRHGRHLHHLVRRSRGGGWLNTNVVLTCVTCHQFEHAALLSIRGNPEPGHRLTIAATGAARAYLLSGPRRRRRARG